MDWKPLLWVLGGIVLLVVIGLAVIFYLGLKSDRKKEP